MALDQHDSSDTDDRPHPEGGSRLSRAKTKVKHLLARGVGNTIETAKEKDSVIADIDGDSAFHPVEVEQHEQEVASGSSVDKTKGALKNAANAVLHPVKTARKKVKRNAAGRISSSQKQFTLPIGSAALLDAHDDCDSTSGDDLSDVLHPNNAAQKKHTRQKQRDKLQRIQAKRESMRVAWTTQHIDRVKAVPRNQRHYPITKNYTWLDSHGRHRFDWLTWLGHLALWYTEPFTAQHTDDFETLPFSINTFRSHAERLIMVTAPWQIWLMDVRSVYRWENPRRTGRWLALWFCIWYFEYIGSFFWACILYYTVRNRVNPSSVDHLRASVKRSLDRESAAYHFGEFVDRHGKDDWLDPLMEEFGPYVQVQINDLANLFEILANFYNWRSPRKTAASLYFLVVSLAIAMLTELRYSIKIISFIAGGGFFFCWPIASLYPKYRLLVSPYRWVLWDIPTDADWAFTYLSSKCNETLQKTSSTRHIQAFEHTKDSSSDESYHSADSTIQSNKTLLKYRAIFQTKPGRLAITQTYLSFSRTLAHNEIWSIPYTSISELRKYQKTSHERQKKERLKSLDKHPGTDGVLEIECHDASTYTLDLQGQRDEVFNYILGFSGVRWMSLQS